MRRVGLRHLLAKSALQESTEILFTMDSVNHNILTFVASFASTTTRRPPTYCAPFFLEPKAPTSTQRLGTVATADTNFRHGATAMVEILTAKHFFIWR